LAKRQATLTSFHEIHFKAKTVPAAVPRPLVLDSGEENADIYVIEAGHVNRNFATLRDVLNYVEAEFGKSLRYGGARNILVWHAGHVSWAIGSAQEKHCLEGPRVFLDNYLVFIKKNTSRWCQLNCFLILNNLGADIGKSAKPS
jgi:hypothetical protein